MERNAKSPSKTTRGRGWRHQKRPDQQFYVPGALRRKKQENNSATEENMCEGMEKKCNNQSKEEISKNETESVTCTNEQNENINQAKEQLCKNQNKTTEGLSVCATIQKHENQQVELEISKNASKTKMKQSAPKSERQLEDETCEDKNKTENQQLTPKDVKQHECDIKNDGERENACEMNGIENEVSSCSEASNFHSSQTSDLQGDLVTANTLNNEYNIEDLRLNNNPEKENDSEVRNGSKETKSEELKDKEELSKLPSTQAVGSAEGEATSCLDDEENMKRKTTLDEVKRRSSPLPKKCTFEKNLECGHNTQALKEEDNIQVKVEQNDNDSMQLKLQSGTSTITDNIEKCGCRSQVSKDENEMQTAQNNSETVNSTLFDNCLCASDSEMKCECCSCEDITLNPNTTDNKQVKIDSCDDSGKEIINTPQSLADDSKYKQHSSQDIVSLPTLPKQENNIKSTDTIQQKHKSTLTQTSITKFNSDVNCDICSVNATCPLHQKGSDQDHACNRKDTTKSDVKCNETLSVVDQTVSGNVGKSCVNTLDSSDTHSNDEMQSQHINEIDSVDCERSVRLQDLFSSEILPEAEEDSTSIKIKEGLCPETLSEVNTNPESNEENIHEEKTDSTAEEQSLKHKKKMKKSKKAEKLECKETKKKKKHKKEQCDDDKDDTYSKDGKRKAKSKSKGKETKDDDGSHIHEVEGDANDDDDDNSDDDEDSWFSKFDEDGECLDPELSKELSKVTGIKKPTKLKTQFDFYSLTEKEVELDDEYGNIVEIYDFSADLQTQDITKALSVFKDQGYELKWVDDTHALAAFSSPLAANQAIQMCCSPLLKLRPVSQGLPESKKKAKRCFEFLQPSKPRPQTMTLTAHRLVTGALGVKSSMTKEEREKERNKLKEAREQKRQEKQRKAEIWGDS